MVTLGGGVNTFCGVPSFACRVSTGLRRRMSVRSPFARVLGLGALPPGVLGLLLLAVPPIQLGHLAGKRRPRWPRL